VDWIATVLMNWIATVLKVINNLAFSINNLDLQLNVFSFTVYSVLPDKVIWIFGFIRTWSLAFLQSLTIISKKYKKQ
jgi:hypothetical protein